MVVVNILANVLPINGILTSQVSEQYSNLFTPSGITFSIWFIIYVLLAYYVYYQFQFNRRRPDNNDRVIRKVNVYFIWANVINGGWIILWHFDRIFLSLLCIFTLLLILFRIRIIITNRSSLTKKEKKAVEFPFSVYFGWISVAFAANFVVYLTSVKWDYLGFEKSQAMVGIILIGLLIYSLVILFFKDIAYGLTIIWAYSGILYKHLSPKGYAGEYKDISYALMASLGVLLVGIFFVYISSRKKRRNYRH